MDFHVIIPGHAPERVARKVDGQLVIVPPVAPAPAAAPVPPAQAGLSRPSSLTMSE